MSCSGGCASATHRRSSYVDLTSLYAWREGKYPKFVWNSRWVTAPACTAQLHSWLRSAGADFWSLRGSLLKSNVSYYHAADRVFHGDKLHLKQVGHTGGASSVASSPLAARGEHRAESGPRHACRCRRATTRPPRASCASCGIGRRAGQAASRVVRWCADRDPACEPTGTREERELGCCQARRRAHRSIQGKWHAFVLESAHNATPLGAATATAALGVRFNVTSPRSSLVIAHMLDCKSTVRPAELGGAPFGPLLYGSSPNFPFHLLTTQRLGTVEGVGEHRLAIRQLRAAPTARGGLRRRALRRRREGRGGGTRPSTAGRCRMIEGTKSRRRGSRGSSLMDFGPEFLDSLQVLRLGLRYPGTAHTGIHSRSSVKPRRAHPWHTRSGRAACAHASRRLPRSVRRRVPRRPRPTAKCFARHARRRAEVLQRRPQLQSSSRSSWRCGAHTSALPLSKSDDDEGDGGEAVLVEPAPSPSLGGGGDGAAEAAIARCRRCAPPWARDRSPRWWTGSWRAWRPARRPAIRR